MLGGQKEGSTPDESYSKWLSAFEHPLLRGPTVDHTRASWQPLHVQQKAGWLSKAS